MDAAQLDTITDVEVLRALVAEQFSEIATRDAVIATHAAAIAQRDQAHAEQLAQRDRTIVYKSAKIEHLTREIARLRRVQFAARTEMLDPEQRALFDEAIDVELAAAQAELDALRAPKAKPAVGARAAPKRRPLPPELPRIEARHETGRPRTD